LAATQAGDWMRSSRRQAAGTRNLCVSPSRLHLSEKHEQHLIDAGRPWRFILNPVVTKKKRDAISSLHPKSFLLCYSDGLDRECSAEYTDLIVDVHLAGGVDDPLYLKIQKFHRDKIADFVSAGGDVEMYAWRLCKSVMMQINMPSNTLLHTLIYTLDPNGTSKYDRVVEALRQYRRKYLSFLKQHEPAHKAVVNEWNLSDYLEVMGNFSVICDASEQWGGLRYRFSCKGCHV
jgi:hypothetical protein